MTNINQEFQLLRANLFRFNSITDQSNIDKKISEIVINYEKHEKDISERVEKIFTLTITSEDIKTKISEFSTKWNKFTSEIKESSTLTKAMQENMSSIKNLAAELLRESTEETFKIDQKEDEEKEAPYLALLQPGVKEKFPLCFRRTVVQGSKDFPHFFLSLGNLFSRILNPQAQGYYGKDINEKFVSGELTQEQILLLLLIDFIIHKQTLGHTLGQVEVFSHISTEDENTLCQHLPSMNEIREYFLQKDDAKLPQEHKTFMRVIAASSKEASSFIWVMEYARLHFRPQTADAITLICAGVSSDIFKLLFETKDWEKICQVLAIRNARTLAELNIAVQNLRPEVRQELLPELCLQMIKEQHALAFDLAKFTFSFLHEAENEDEPIDENDLALEFAKKAAIGLAAYDSDMAVTFAKTLPANCTQIVLYEISYSLIPSKPETAFSICKDIINSPLKEIFKKFLDCHGDEKILEILKSPNNQDTKLKDRFLIQYYCYLQITKNIKPTVESIKTEFSLNSENEINAFIENCALTNMYIFEEKLLGMSFDAFYLKYFEYSIIHYPTEIDFHIESTFKQLENKNNIFPLLHCALDKGIYEMDIPFLCEELNDSQRDLREHFFERLIDGLIDQVKKINAKFVFDINHLIDIFEETRKKKEVLLKLTPFVHEDRVPELIECYKSLNNKIKEESEELCKWIEQKNAEPHSEESSSEESDSGYEASSESSGL